MPSHTFNTQAGALATGGTGGGSAQVTGSVTIEKVRDLSGGIGLNNAQYASSSSLAAADTDLQVIFKRPTTTQLQLRVQDDSSASGPGAATDYDAAFAWDPDNSTTHLYNDMTGGSNGPTGVVGSYEWRQTDYTDGEGMSNTRLDVRWNSVLVFTALIYAGQSSVTGSDGLTYTKGTQFSNTMSTDYHRVTQGDPSFSAYAFNSNVGTITAIKMKVNVTSMSNTAGSVAPLRNLAGSQLSSGANDSGWITSNLGTGITLDIRHAPNDASSPAGNAVYAFNAEVELWARASGVSDTKLKDFKVLVNTTVDI